MKQNVEKPPRIKVNVDKRGRFMIPLAFRKELGLKAGDEIVMTWKDDEVRIVKAANPKARTRRRTIR